ncbi:MAG: ThiF family adenylyltransferase [Clostridia bacterium]|nr:ThiF family adenylyltransferase [Clostridia bacterium]
MYEKTQMLFGDLKLKKLKDANIIVFGVGGVGGYVIEMLARTGVGSLTIVDGDVISASNINRQIIALNSNIGKPKVEVMAARLKDINTDINVKTIYKRFNKNSISEFDLAGYDYIIDAIDSIQDKVLLIELAKKINIKIISSMGTGNRSYLPSFKIGDVFTTTYDTLAKKLRKELKKTDIKSLTVAYTDEQPTKQTPTASVAYYPATCGILIASYVINVLIAE